MAFEGDIQIDSLDGQTVVYLSICTIWLNRKSARILPPLREPV